jgi:outer membrane immunogenic protein
MRANGDSIGDKGDMKKLLLVTAATVVLFGAANPGQAADMAVKAAPPPPVMAPLFTWTGFYIGGNLGAAWANRTVTDAFGNSFTRSSDARFMGGGQLGYNWQVGGFVLGVEGDIDGIASDNNRGSAPLIINGAGPFVVTSGDGRWVATLAARFGWAIDHVLLYGKAGGGWIGNDNGITVTNVTTGTTFGSAGGNNSRGGWLLGGGVEWAISNNWSIKGEYDFIGLGSRNVVVPVVVGGGVVDTFGTSNRGVSLVKFGFNYSFR